MAVQGMGINLPVRIFEFSYRPESGVTTFGGAIPGYGRSRNDNLTAFAQFTG